MSSTRELSRLRLLDVSWRRLPGHHEDAAGVRVFWSEYSVTAIIIKTNSSELLVIMLIFWLYIHTIC